MKIETTKGVWVQVSPADHVQGVKPGQLVGPSNGRSAK